MKQMRGTLLILVMAVALGGCTKDSVPTERTTGRPASPMPSPTKETGASIRERRNCDVAEGRSPETMVVYLLEPDWRVPRIKDFVPAERGLDKGERLRPLRAALLKLLDGLSARERRLGCQSIFDNDSHLLNDVVIDDGLAIVNLLDFNEDLPGVGTTTASTIFMTQLNLTVFQFPNIESIRYELNGSCEQFFRMLEGTCQIFHRQGNGWRVEAT
jgi:spore germination protein GerM